jgi:hypothetical protein
MKILLNTNSLDDYRLFLRIKSLPRYRIYGHMAEFPDEYADRLGIQAKLAKDADYTAPAWMFDYQRDITPLAIKKRKFALFIDCGFGKTNILF